MTTFHDENEAVTYIFRSMRKLRGQERPPDDIGRDTRPTRLLLERLDLLDTDCEYVVVTGSKGKGSTTVMTARMLRALGHTTGTITSPHLVTWRERIRVNGRAIPEADFLRILGEIAPDIDAIEATLSESQYFSPQGIFLALALRWFEEQGVTVGVLEVGRGGRFDDIAVVNNRLSLFTPITLEHVYWLGPTVERIAWHKAGIIKARSQAYSVAQAPEVMAVLAREAEVQEAQFDWIAPMDQGQYIGPAPDGQRVQFGRYGEVTLALRGRFQIENASLAVVAAGFMHDWLGGIGHASPEYVAAIREGLEKVNWPGRCQKLQDYPTVYLDGAINGESARGLVNSLRDELRAPVVSIVAVPDDKDYEGVYAALGPVSDRVILTDTTRNPILSFLSPDAAIAAARAHARRVDYAPDLDTALDAARAFAGTGGTVLIVGTQSLLADAINLWGYSYEQI